MNYKLIEPKIRMEDPISQILVNRGIEPQNVNQYLNPTNDDFLSPLLLDNIQAGAKLLA